MLGGTWLLLATGAGRWALVVDTHACTHTLLVEAMQLAASAVTPSLHVTVVTDWVSWGLLGLCVTCSHADATA